MTFDRKHLFCTVALAAAVIIAPSQMNAQPGHGGPPPGQAKKGYYPPPGQGGPGRGHQDFRMDRNYRDQVARYYRSDVERYRNRKRPVFAPGYTIPRNYSIRPVPQSYWRGMPPPPPGYQYGYYDGYMVAYDPTTRIIADVMDLVTAFAH